MRFHFLVSAALLAVALPLQAQAQSGRACMIESDEVFALGEKEILRAANHASAYNILHICDYLGHRNELD